MAGGVKEWSIEHRDPAKLKDHPKNPRIHPDSQVEGLGGAMAEFGITSVLVVDENDQILAGHARKGAASKRGVSKYPVIVVRGWSEQKKLAFMLADNRWPMLAGWDETVLRAGITELQGAEYDLEIAGYDKLAVGQLFAGVGTGKDPEETPEPPKAPVSRLGDLWVMGEHRLLCGDSTRAEAVTKAFDGAKPGLMVTDPPYGVEYDANWRNEADRANGKAYGDRAISAVHNDDRNDWREAWALFPGDIVYCWHAGRHASAVQASLESVGFEMVSQVIWAKTRLIISRGDYHWQHEPCWYAVRKGKKHNWSGDRSQTTLWTIEHAKSETGHSTQKPVECMRRPIQNNTNPGDVVYDPFTGSGTTIISCDLMKRRFRGLELSPAYVDVCVQRWQQYAGGVATLAGTGKTFAQMAKERLGEYRPGPKAKKGPPRIGTRR